MKNKNSDKDLHAEHRKRVKANVMKNGFSQLEEHELLELLLFYSIPRANTNQTAHLLLNEFGSLSAVVKAPKTSLMKIKGVGKETALYLNSLGELTSRIFKQAKIKKKSYKYEDVIELAASYFINEPNERVLLLCFDSLMHFKTAEFVVDGNVSEITLELKKLVSAVIEADASVVVIAHNHPNGNPEPSLADFDATGAISVMLRKLDVVLLDHIIVAEGAVFSMRNDERSAKMFGEL